MNLQTVTISVSDNENIQTGIRHMAFKVRDVDSVTAKLKQANIQFTLDPVDAILFTSRSYDSE